MLEAILNITNKALIAQSDTIVRQRNEIDALRKESRERDKQLRQTLDQLDHDKLRVKMFKSHCLPGAAEAIEAAVKAHNFEDDDDEY